MRRPSQRSKSPTIRTLRAFGAQTAKLTPVDALVRARMGAEHVVQPLVRALGDQVQVDVAERRREAVRVVELPGVAVGKAEADAVRELPGPQVRQRTRPTGRRPAAPSAAIPPFGATSHAALASGWKARMTVPSAAGCAPRIACGSWCSPRARRADSSLGGAAWIVVISRNDTRPIGLGFTWSTIVRPYPRRQGGDPSRQEGVLRMASSAPITAQ